MSILVDSNTRLLVQGITGRPVRRAHNARSPHTSASTSTAASKIKNITSPATTTTARMSQRVRPAKKSFKQPPRFSAFGRWAGMSTTHCQPPKFMPNVPLALIHKALAAIIFDN